ncbi:ATP-binding protein [Actinomadura viridis]|uniref:ATP-binding protein n=1 Tax=Actinomadura viridis TaxID=58110 RepID=UPI00368AF85A
MIPFSVDLPADLPGYGLVLPGSTAAPSAARALVAAALDEWGLSALDGDADLVASELVTNAVLRSPRAAFMIVLHPSHEVELMVWDEAPGRPRERRADPMSDTGGRGLFLVGAVSTAWGCRPVPGGGKITWARLGPKPKETLDDALAPAGGPDGHAGRRGR